MTTATQIPGLTATNTTNGKTYYETIIRQCRGGSKFNDKKTDEQRQYQFENLEDYWTIGKNIAPHANDWYALELSVKPADKGMWRDIVKIDAVDGPATSTEQTSEEMFEGMGDPRAGEPKQNQPSGSEKPNAPVDDTDTRIRKGQSANMAVALLAGALGNDEGDWEYLHDDDNGLTHGIRVLRDRIYNEVLDIPVAPLRYCYTHEEPRRKTRSGVFAHPVSENVFCTEAGLLDAQGQPVDTQDPEHVDDLPF